jgi:WD40 repeat protein
MMFRAASRQLPLIPVLAHHRGGRGGVQPDGTHVVTASDDETARVWDAATGR